MSRSLYLYLAAFPVCLFLAFVFCKTTLKEWSWQRWFVIFAIANTADIMSTFFGVFSHNWDWSRESNVVVALAGPYVGFGATLVLLKLLVLALAYQAGVYWGKYEMTRAILFMASLGMFLAALNNTIVGLGAVGAST